MNTPSRTNIDSSAPVNPSNDRRSDSASQAAVSLWQKTIDDKGQNIGTSILGSAQPQKTPGGMSNAGPDAFQQSQFLSRFGKAPSMQDGVTEQGGILAQISYTGEQDETADVLDGQTASQTVSRDVGDSVSDYAVSYRDDDLVDEIDSVDVLDASRMDFIEQRSDESSIGVAGGAKGAFGESAADIRHAQQFSNIVERFADRFLLEMDAGTSMKQMQMQLNAAHLPDTSLVLQQSGNTWTLRAQTRSSEVGDKLKLAESSLKERFRARGLGDITLDVQAEEYDNEHSELV
jgi:hypothetical protein